MADDIKILKKDELRRIVGIDLPMIEVVEQAFAALAEGQVIMPPILSMRLDAVNADVDVKTAYIQGFDGFAIKMSPGFFDNPKIGLPSTSGLMVLFSATTGMVQAVLLDRGYLTDLRTAAAGAVAAKYLAPEVHIAGVIGTGVQARVQMQAAHLVRPFEAALVWGRDADKAESCAADLAKSLGIPVEATIDREGLVRQSQLVVTTTPSRAPLIEAEWLHPGLHITAMGSDTHGKVEVSPAALAAADLYVPDHLGQCAELGELAPAIKAGLMPATGHPELGQIVTGRYKGRGAESDVTIADLTGTGAQDTAIATYALKRAKAQGL